jgi:hypothetical protein
MKTFRRDVCTLIYPDGPDQTGAIVKAFAVQGGPLQIPAPLVRVTEGTEIERRSGTASTNR